jgi:hypothetical protein
MAASAAGSAKLPGLPEFIVMMKPAANNSKQAVKEFPKFMVNCWIKDSAASAPASEAANPRQTNPFEHYPFVFDSETCKLFEDFNESKCRSADALCQFFIVCIPFPLGLVLTLTHAQVFSSTQ